MHCDPPSIQSDWDRLARVMAMNVPAFRIEIQIPTHSIRVVARRQTRSERYVSRLWLDMRVVIPR